jgi:pimeloyl-ACP methyl ester carboxylesterase
MHDSVEAMCASRDIDAVWVASPNAPHAQHTIAARLPVEQINLGVYAKRVTDALDAQRAPVILVGHSSGCLAASRAAEERPEKVRMLVFLSGFVAANGEAHRALLGADPGQKVSPLLLVDFRPQTKIPLQTRIDTSKPDAVKLAFYNDCSDADARAAMARLVPEPAGPSGRAATPKRGALRPSRQVLHSLREGQRDLARAAARVCGEMADAPHPSRSSPGIRRS